MTRGHRTNRRLSATSAVTPLWAAVAALATRQHGVVSIDQLRSLGFTDRAVQYRLATGHLHRIHRGVYAVGHRRLAQTGRFMAAVLACGDHCALSHRSAAALLDIRACSRSVVEVTVSGCKARSRPGIQVHSSQLLIRDVTTLDGISCTSVARTLLDLSEVLDRDSLAKALERTQILRVFDLHQFQDVLGRANGRRGTARPRPLIDELSEPSPARSELERAFRALCQRASLPQPLVNSTLDLGDQRLEIDFLWPEQRLAVETDGFETHGTRSQFERDRLRDQRLVLAGYRVLRFTWRQVMEAPAEVARTLRAALAARAPALRAC